MNWFYTTLFILVQLFLPGFIVPSVACWGTTATNYGDTTRDYDLLIGSELGLNCTLKSERLAGISLKVDSSHLVFKKDNKILNNYTHLIDSRTAQLIIPNAQVSDSGIYHCVLSLPDTTSMPHVCSTQVSVGYAPRNVTNFQCISRNFDNLTCTWDIEVNKVKTNYSLQKNLFSIGAFQNCPSFNNTFCQWRDDTDPPYQTSNRNITFIVHGNNSLGTSENEFMLDHFKIVIPNSPENLTATEIGKHDLKIRWLPPTMNNIIEKPVLFYQLWLEELGPDPQEKIVIDIGLEKFTYKLEGLIPFFWYNISLRCRSHFTLDENMWSPILSIQLKTKPDVPSLLPEVNPLAFELYNFEAYRNATLYWKPPSKRYYNGEDFHYHIVYQPKYVSDSKQVMSTKSYLPVITIGHLNNDSAYIFKIHSANREGISSEYKEVFIAERNKIAPAPNDIRAISHGLGFYNLSWSMPDQISSYTYTVFWCSSVRPSKSRCDGPIYWTETNLKDNSFILNIPNMHINFQFAVVAVKGNESSGMEWASCIVPRKAPLGKIPIRHIEQKDADALKIIWNLDCEAQKSVIDRYEITYCRLKKKAQCKVATADANSESYLLKDLHPFSNYSIKLRAFNKENVPSEDILESYQSTLPGAPSDPPQNIKILTQSGTSFTLNWIPPLEPNGIITHYYIFYNEWKQKILAETARKLYYHTISGLSYFSKYNVSVQACVDTYCSPESQPIEVVTDVGEPGYMDRPRIEILNSTNLKISWTAPVIPNGPIDFYSIRWQQQGENITYHKETRSLSTVVEFDCSTVLDGGRNYLFYVQAANKRNDAILIGPLSESTQATACILSQGRAMVIGLAIGGTLTLAVFIIVFYRLVKWMHDKIHQMKNIAVRLPKELEGPELNPLSNYDSFKHGLVQKNQNNKTDRLSYVFEENENKNRHGSGSSQFSNSSADELVFKNGKCTKFGRKPSGDSSGCSSMSSNTTTRIHLSSDSGAESDFPAPESSPDSGLMNHNTYNIQKSPLPILVEQEALDLTSEMLVRAQYSTYLHNNLRAEHPYSKFGVSGVASIPWRSNSLAFYSCNLANSEPSVFETQKSDKESIVMAPYSKIGLAKSSGDIMSVVNPPKSTGYSKFGLNVPPDRFVIDAANLNQTVGFAMVDSSLNKELPRTFRNALPEKHLSKDYNLRLNDLWLNNCNAEHRYLKNRTEQSASSKPSSGYVSIGDVRSGKEPNSFSKTQNSVDIDDLSDTSLVDIPSDSEDPHLSWILKDICTTENHVEQFPELYNQDRHLIDLSHSSSDNSVQISSSSSGLSSASYTPTPSDFTHIHGTNKNIPQLDCTVNTSNNELQQPHLKSKDSKISYQNASGSPNSLCSSEILLTPVVKKNGYVPFSNFSSPQNTVPHVPNILESNSPLSVFPSDICSDFDHNYITPSNKTDLKILQENMVSKNSSLTKVPSRGKDLLTGGKIYTLNGSSISKISGPLKYLLKPLPKMESEICEV